MTLQATRHHPSAVDLELVKRLVATTKCSSLQRFLSQEFSSIDRDLAGGFKAWGVDAKASASLSLSTDMMCSCVMCSCEGWGSMHKPCCLQHGS